MQSETSLLHQALYFWIQSIKVKYELQTATNLIISLKPQQTLIEKTSSLQRNAKAASFYCPMKLQSKMSYYETELIKDHMIENIVYPEVK